MWRVVPVRIPVSDTGTFLKLKVLCFLVNNIKNNRREKWKKDDSQALSMLYYSIFNSPNNDGLNPYFIA